MDKDFSDLGDKRKDIERDDHNAELSGTKAGYNYVTSASEGGDSRSDVRAKKARAAEARLTALEALMLDPAYAALYNDTRDVVRDALIAAHSAMEVAVEQLDAAKDALSGLQDKAAKLAPDGERVYRHSDGHVYTEGGRKLTSDEAASVVFPDGAPDRNDFRQLRRDVETAEQAVNEAGKIENRLGEYKNRLDDPKNAYSADELRDIQQDVEKRMTSLAHDAPNTKLDDAPSLETTAKVKPLDLGG